jgi:hypothetical protein
MTGFVGNLIAQLDNVYIIQNWRVPRHVMVHLAFCSEDDFCIGVFSAVQLFCTQSLLCPM